MKSIAILGASRGLGAALKNLIEKQHPDIGILSLDRSVGVDFTQPDQYDQICRRLRESEVEQIFYVAGGGPYGSYGSKAWKDHEWALRLNFLFPAQLLHFFLADPGILQRILFVGSAIAEDRADPGAASYSAGKHALKGLIHSVIEEGPEFCVQLYSPGYMDTQMLPSNAWPRQQGLAEDPNAVARRLWQWSQSTVECGSFQEAANDRSQS